VTARTKFKVPAYGNLNKALIFQSGAQIGVDLALPDGSVPGLSELAAALAPYLTASSSTPAPVNTVVFWSQIQSIPANVQQVVALASVGLVTRQTDGTWITSAIDGTAGRIVVANGNGDLGDPTIDLATVSVGAGGVLATFTVDAYGRVTQRTARTITGTATRIAVSNGDGAAGNPTIDLVAVSQDANGVLYAIELDSYGRVTGHRVADLVDLDDVLYPTGTPADGDVLTYNSGQGWIPAPPTGGGGSSYPPPQLLISGCF